MKVAHQDLPVEDFQVPQGVEFFKIDRLTGLLGGDYTEAYIRGTRPLIYKPIEEEVAELEELSFTSFE